VGRAFSELFHEGLEIPRGNPENLEVSG
jgi:hypothetical protein